MQGEGGNNRKRGSNLFAIEKTMALLSILKYDVLVAHSNEVVCVCKVYLHIVFIS